MGTVGLSFGSPTSGTGFDVSSTVAEIVTNLQNVETPWKNQLTSLESQDTTISSLGTLLSTVSNDMSTLTDFQGTMAQKTGSSSDTNVLELTAASSSALAGTHTVVVNSLAQTSSGYLAPITNTSDTLSGSITLGAGTSTAQTIKLDSSDDTLAGLASAINSSGAGVTASVLTDANGSRLSLVSGTSGASGDITVSANSIADSTTGSGTLAYTSTTSGKNASLTVDGVDLASTSNTVTNLIPGLTFQLLATSPTGSDGTAEAVQVVIGNDNSSVESAVDQFVSDYNSLVSAMNTQEGNTSSGTPEPLFGSPTLSLLQQQLLSGIDAGSPSGYLDAIASTGTTLADQSTFSIQMADGASATFVVGSGSDSAVPGTYYTDNTDTGGVNNGDTLDGLAATINAAAGTPLLSYSGTAGTSTTTSNGTLNGIANENDILSGSLSIQAGSGTAQTVTLDTSGETLSQLVSDINNTSNIGVTASITQDGNTGLYSLALTSGTTGTAGTLTVTSNVLDTNKVGVTAGVATSNGQSTLTLASWTAGAAGALTVTSNVTANAGAQLTNATFTASSTENSVSSFSSIPSASDVLSGSATIQVGSGAAVTVNVPDSAATLQGFADAINGTSGIGVTASVVTNSDGTQNLSITSNTAGSDGNLTVTSNLFDTTDSTSTALNYNSSSDINNLSSLGITANNDGTLTLDVTSLDSVLNSDFSSVANFFQAANGWGQGFATTLTNAGSSSSRGILSLASSSNSTIESQLNARVSREESLISVQQASLTAELNSANEILQGLPTQLTGMNELYSAISGYNQGSNG